MQNVWIRGGGKHPAHRKAAINGWMPITVQVSELLRRERNRRRSVFLFFFYSCNPTVFMIIYITYIENNEAYVFISAGGQIFLTLA